MFEISALFALWAVSSIECNMASCCSKNQCSMTNLDIAIDILSKAKLNTSVCNDCDSGLMKRAVDCTDIFHMGYHKSGVYKIRPINRLTEDKFVNVYCDMETDGGGWTVIQRRGDFERPHDYFCQDWKNYKRGFGDLEKDFWLGNDNIFALTNQRLYSVRFDLKDVQQERRYAHYDEFWIDDENQKYTLHISGYMGDAGDCMVLKTKTGRNHDSQKFTTQDQDNDDWEEKNCAVEYKGGWWYNACRLANLNGLYLKGKLNSTFVYQGVSWESFKGWGESLEWTEIKIRPKNYRFSSDSANTPIE